jgi:hypothetical protein
MGTRLAVSPLNDRIRARFAVRRIAAQGGGAAENAPPSYGARLFGRGNGTARGRLAARAVKP